MFDFLSFFFILAPLTVLLLNFKTGILFQIKSLFRKKIQEATKSFHNHEFSLFGLNFIFIRFIHTLHRKSLCPVFFSFPLVVVSEKKMGKLKEILSEIF